MNLQEIIDELNRQLLDRENRCFSSTEIIVLNGIWENKTYGEMAKDKGYSKDYFANVVAPELFRTILVLVGGKKVTKKNCRAILEKFAQSKFQAPSQMWREGISSPSPQIEYNAPPVYPSGAVPLNSPFYLKRANLEKQILQEVTKQGALVRIKAPQERGKTSLLLRILDGCQKQLGYKTISINLQQADQKILNNINAFLRWICVNCARELKLPPNLKEYWDEDLGSKMSWTIYFEEYILEQFDCPIILALDEVNEIFEHPTVASDFFPLLRSCFEEAKRKPLWQKLRLIVVHSTEIYVALKLEQSPFNVGLPVEIERFNHQQIQQLAQKYGFTWKLEEEVEQLMELVAGHPRLVHLAIYYLHQNRISFEQLIETATTNTGIYADHLQRHWVRLQEREILARAFKQVCHAKGAISLDPIVAYQLNSMGLIDLKGNQATVSCRLYKDYFENQ